MGHLINEEETIVKMRECSVCGLNNLWVCKSCEAIGCLDCIFNKDSYPKASFPSVIVNPNGFDSNGKPAYTMLETRFLCGECNKDYSKCQNYKSQT